VPGAASYRVAIAHDAAMTGVMEIASTTDTTYAMVERGGGGYWAQVRAVGPEGIVGEWSPARSLRVVHYTVPDGATVARDGAIVLPLHLSVKLADADGLEMAYATTAGRSPVPLYWSPVSGSLRLPDDADVRVVHLRDPALGQETSLTICRRALRVDIDMSPRNPQPSSVIDVRAVAWDPTRRLDPAQEQITLEVTRDLTAVPVAWRQAGSTWTARIPPSPTMGPTVIRVVARDAFGAEIGRGFVEIADSVQEGERWHVCAARLISAPCGTRPVSRALGGLNVEGPCWCAPAAAPPVARRTRSASRVAGHWSTTRTATTRCSGGRSPAATA
jgi:hypothetical protein